MIKSGYPFFPVLFFLFLLWNHVANIEVAHDGRNKCQTPEINVAEAVEKKSSSSSEYPRDLARINRAAGVITGVLMDSVSPTHLMVRLNILN